MKSSKKQLLFWTVHCIPLNFSFVVAGSQNSKLYDHILAKN